MAFGLVNCLIFRIFATTYYVLKVMKPKETTCNALNVRGINKIPPPVSKRHIEKNTSRFTATTFTLLHQAYASCGRVLCVCLLALLPLFWSSCEKELARYPEIQQYYTESLTL